MTADYIFRASEVDERILFNKAIVEEREAKIK